MREDLEEMVEMEKLFEGLPKYDFLDWCIDCSFKDGELSGMTEIQLEKTKKTASYMKIKDQPVMVISTYKALVEFNLIVKQVKWGILLVIGYVVVKAISP